MIKFKKKIQFYFKRFFQLVFVLIYGKIKYKNNVITSKNITKKKLRTLFLILTVLKVIFLIKLRMEEFIQIMLSMLQLLMATP